jgi:histone acetyltransferase (RNA polymerase elongator complex component)
MEEKNNGVSQEFPIGNLNKCPHCACCFCNEADLKKHIETFGETQAMHQQEFQRVHGRLEHGSSGGPE